MEFRGQLRNDKCENDGSNSRKDQRNKIEILPSKCDSLIKVGKELPHELFLTTRQNTKTRNTFATNMSTGLKLSKSQLF